jgi:hypothetical protein
VEFYREPDAIRTCIVAVPGINPTARAYDPTKGIMRQTLRHYDILKKSSLVLFPKFLHPAATEDLRVNFKKGMFVVDETVRVSGRPPEIQLDLEGHHFLFDGPLVGEDEGIEFNVPDAVLRGDI